jgi:hypothetical protein
MDLELLQRSIRFRINRKLYRIRIHTVRHMVEEGFSERDITEAINNGEILEYYPEDKRCLVLGHFCLQERTKLALHIVCDFSNSKSVDIRTAYIPQKPWWVSPKKRGRKQ